MPVPIIAVHAAAVYLVFLAVLGYAAGFFAGAGVPKSIDQGPRAAVPAAMGRAWARPTPLTGPACPR
jgi:hypothetical protein